jgi:outer membrane protein W
MKKLLLYSAIVGLVMLSSHNATAQHMMIGARIGANLANESEDSLPSGSSTSIHAGFLAGAQFDYWFNDMWGLSAQVLYDQKGATLNISESESEFGESFSETGTADVILNYLEIPILVKASFGTGNIRPYVFAGPSFGIFLSGSEKVNATGTLLGVTSSVDSTVSILDSTIKTLEISAIFGAGISLKLSSGQVLFFDAAYSLGLTNISVNSNGSNQTTESRDIRLAAGILFPLD